MHRSPDLKWYIVIVLLILILASLLYMIFNNSPRPSNLSSVNTDFSLFDSVTASVTGKITSVGSGTIFFENQQGKKGEGLILETISISDMNSQDLPTSDLSKIQLNKTATINLVVTNSKYYVSSITYPQP